MKKDWWKCRYEDPATRDENICTDQKLIRSLGALGIAAVPGASIWTEGRGTVRMDTAAWNWLRPLLMELKEHRESVKSGSFILGESADSPSKED